MLERHVELAARGKSRWGHEVQLEKDSLLHCLNIQVSLILYHSSYAHGRRRA